MDIFTFFIILIITLSLISLLTMYISYHYKNYQDNILYLPTIPEDSRQHCPTPTQYGLTIYEQVNITTDDNIILRGYIIRPEGSSFTDQNKIDNNENCCIIYFHGNAGNVGHRLPIAKLMVRNMKACVVMVDYRCYGLSDSRDPPTEEGLKKDGISIIKYVINNVKLAKTRRIYIVGMSLGGAVATYLATLPEVEAGVHGLVLENTFTCISDMVDVVAEPIVRSVVTGTGGNNNNNIWDGKKEGAAMPTNIQRKYIQGCLHSCIISCTLCFLGRVAKPLILQLKWDNKSRIRNIKLPILFLSSRKDSLIPCGHMDALHAAAVSSIFKKIVKFPHGTHNDLYCQEGYCQAMIDWMEEMEQINIHSKYIDNVV